MNSIKGKVVVITGASKGIGAQIARDMAGQGAKVVINYASSKHEAQKVLADIHNMGGTAILAKADVRNEEEVIHLFDRTLQAFSHRPPPAQ